MRYGDENMGNFMGRMILVIIIITYTIQIAAAAGNDTPEPSLFIGNPIDAFQKLSPKTQGQIQWLIGLVAAAVIIMGIIALFASHAKTSAGVAVGNAAMRNEGANNILMIVGVGILLIVAIGVFWFVMTGGI